MPPLLQRVGAEPKLVQQRLDEELRKVASVYGGEGGHLSQRTLKVLDAFFVSRPSDIARRLSTWVTVGTLWGHLATTLAESLLGLVVFSGTGTETTLLGFVHPHGNWIDWRFSPTVVHRHGL